MQHHPICFEVAFADHLPFPADTFDAVISRFGVMFFPAPVDGVREMKPGRKLALAVWHFAERNPFHYSLARVITRNIDRHVDSPPLAPDAMDAFRFAAPGKLRGVLEEAGVTVLTERLLQFTIKAPVSVERILDVAPRNV